MCAPATLARVLGTLRSTPGIADVVRDQWLRMREAHDLTCKVTYALSATGEHYVTLTWWCTPADGVLAQRSEVHVDDGDDEREHELTAYGSTSLEALAGVLSKPKAWAHGKVTR